MKNQGFIIITFLFISSCWGNEEKGIAMASEQHKVVDNLTSQVEAYPDSAGLRMRLINSLDSLKMYKEAIAQADSLIKRDSANNGLWFTKAQLQEENKDTAGAIASYTRAIRIYPSVEARLSLANLFAESRNSKALLICQEVSAMALGRETDANCEFVAGVFYSRTGDKKKALSFFDKAINDNYTLSEAYMEKGFIYYEDRKFQEALQVFDRAIRVNNTYADAYYWKAKCNEALGNKSDAIIDYKRSLGLDKQLKEAADAIKRLQ